MAQLVVMYTYSTQYVPSYTSVLDVKSLPQNCTASDPIHVTRRSLATLAPDQTCRVYVLFMRIFAAKMIRTSLKSYLYSKHMHESYRHTIQYATLHDNALHCSTAIHTYSTYIHHNTMHYIRFHDYITVHYSSLYYSTLHYIKLHCVALHAYIT